MSDIAMTRADKAQEFSFIIDTASLLDAGNGRFFNKLANRDASGDPNTIDKDDLKEALKLDDRKREYGRGFLTDCERKSVKYMLKHWDDEKLKVLRDDLISYDSKGNDYRHQGYAQVTRRSVERAVTFYAQPIPPMGAEIGPPIPQSHKPNLSDAGEREQVLRHQQRRDAQLQEMQQREPQLREHAQAPGLKQAADHAQAPGHKQTADQGSKQNCNAPAKSENCPDSGPVEKKPTEAQILKNTQDYLSGKSVPQKEGEYRPYISQDDAARDEMRRRQIFAMTPSESNYDRVQSGGHHNEHFDHGGDRIESAVLEPRYSFRDGVHDALGIIDGVSRAAAPFLMWDLAKEHARNGSGIYRRSNHLGDPYYGRPPSPWLYDRPFRPHFNPGYGGNYGPYSNYWPHSSYDPRFGGDPYYGRGPRFGGNYYPQDSDMEFSHAGPDGLTFSRSRQRVPHGGPPAPYYPRGGYDGYDRYSGNGLYDTLDLVNGLSRAALPWLQWDLAKQHARNQRDFYNNRQRRW